MPKLVHHGISPLAYIILSYMLLTGMTVTFGITPLFLPESLESKAPREIYGSLMIITPVFLYIGFNLESELITNFASLVGFFVHLYATILYSLTGLILGVGYVAMMTIVCAYFFLGSYTHRLWDWHPYRPRG